MERVRSFNSFMKEFLIIYKPVYWFAGQIIGLVLYDRDLRHERVKNYFLIILGKTNFLRSKENYFFVKKNIPRNFILYEKV